MLGSADRKILTEQAYSAQRSYGVSGARRVARLRVRLLCTTDWTAVIDADRRQSLVEFPTRLFYIDILRITVLAALNAGPRRSVAPAKRRSLFLPGG
jgi:hypothetical protein